MNPSFNIETSIKIEFTNDQILDILKAKVKEEVPNIDINGLDFAIKRNPTSVNVVVDASLQGFNTPVVTKAAETGVEETEEEVIEEATEELEIEEEVEEEVVEEVESLFGES